MSLSIPFYVEIHEEAIKLRIFIFDVLCKLYGFFSDYGSDFGGFCVDLAHIRSFNI